MQAPDGSPVIAQINSSWVTRVRRDDLVTFHVDGTHGSAVAGLTDCRTQARVNTPKPVWNPDVRQPLNFFEHWQMVPEYANFDNGFKLQWEAFIRHLCEDAPYKWTLLEGAKGVQLVECRCGLFERAPLGRCAGAQGVTERNKEHIMNAPEKISHSIKLPTNKGQLENFVLSAPRDFPAKPARAFTRIAYSAAHVVANPLAANDPWLDCSIDWDATMRYRRHLWSLEIGMAEAMDTAQRQHPAWTGRLRWS